MNTRWMIFPCCFLYSIVSAQSVSEVVNAEKAFAQHAVTYNVKQAFLKYLDSNGVVFNKGEVLNGIKSWQEAPEGSGILRWYPAYAGIAAGGDLGFTTGPFEFRKALTDSVLSCGQYTTVWIKTVWGEWRFLIDLGVIYQTSLYNKQAPVGMGDGNDTIAGLLAEDTTSTGPMVLPAEQQFIRDYTTHSSSAFRHVITAVSWFNIHQQTPRRGPEEIMQALEVVPGNLEFIPFAGEIARSKDLAYVYGFVKYKGRKENYLRIWGHTSTGWKILVQVLKW